MAFHILSRVSAFKSAVLPSSKAQILSRFYSSSDANSVFSKWKAIAKSFFSKLGVKSSGLVEEFLGVKRKRVDVLTLCKQKSVKEITFFPPEALESEERLWELFELWMKEFEKSYSTEEEKLERFAIFKGRLVRTVWHIEWYQLMTEANGLGERKTKFTLRSNSAKRDCEGPRGKGPYYQRLREENKINRGFYY